MIALAAESSGHRVAADLRGFGPLGLLAILIIAAFDLTALAIIYWNLESDVAHLVFK